MKKGILILVSIAALIACKKEAEKTQSQPKEKPEGIYQLTEVLMDPGDGSGTFQPVNSKKTIELFSNDSLYSNGNICSMDPGTGTASHGTYSLADSSIALAGCDTLDFDLTDSTLIINYFCIEPCRAKYRKLIPLYPN